MSKTDKKKNNEENNEEENPLHKDYSLKQNLKFIFGYMFHADKALRLLIPLGIIVAPIMNYLWTFMTKFVIDMVMDGQTWKKLLPLILVFTGIQIISTMLNSFYWNHVWYRYIGVRMNLMTRLNHKSMTVDFEHLENPDVMDAFRKAQNSSGGTDTGVEGIMRTGVNCMSGLSTALVGLAIMGTLQPVLIMLLLITATLSFFISDKVNAYTKKNVWDVLSSWWRKNDYMNRISTDFNAAKDIRMFHLSDWLMEKIRELNRFRYNMQKKNELFWYYSGIFDNVMWMLSQTGIYAFIIYNVVAGTVSIGNGTLYIATAGTFYGNVSGILSKLSELRQRSREVNDFRSFLDFEGGDERHSEVPIPVPNSDSYTFTFEEVSFQYPKSENYALKDLNLTLEAGERLAVVGLNGAGKSTFIKLLLRLYEPTKGRILLNGVDIRTYDKNSYYELFAPLFQEVELFAFPLSENISMDTPIQTSEKRAEECLHMSGMDTRVASLKDGIKTEVLKIIDEEGVDFSGGERQKLALARALYKDTSIVVLDEPTAALDALAEYKLYQDFDTMIGKKSAVYISHRLSSTRFCKHVAMFAEGRMVEYGTHESLLAAAGAYAEMFRVQAQYYLEEGGVSFEESNS